MARMFSYREALNEALAQEMRRDPAVVVFGEDVIGGVGTAGLAERGLDEAWGGVMGVTKGLCSEFGTRVRDTPITESAFIGAAVGAAATGLRPVVELMYIDFVGVCLDQIMNQAAKLRYMFGGKVRVPLVVRTMYGAGFSAGAQHSQSLYPMLVHLPGLKVVVPSNAYDAKGLLAEAIRDDDPVIFFEHAMLYDTGGDVPEESYTIPFGEAWVAREGNDVTIVAVGRMVRLAVEAAGALSRSAGVECEVIDPRTLSPLDEDSILESLSRTGRLVVVDESSPRCGFGSEIASLAAQRGFELLRAPVRTVTPPHVPVPFAPALESAYLPDTGKIVSAVEAVLESRDFTVVS
jgi:acetoin:2,6-dichlorophenolindophenol oxidoreductase subunit beta